MLDLDYKTLKMNFLELITSNYRNNEKANC